MIPKLFFLEFYLFGVMLLLVVAHLSYDAVRAGMNKLL